MPRQDVTTRVATAVGREADGRRLVAETESFLDDIAAANPQLAGRTSRCC